MRLLIVDQCSSSKQVPNGFVPYTQEEVDSHSVEDLLAGINGRDDVPSFRAERLYRGRQQLYINDACDRLRDAGDEVDHVFISAGFGLVDEETELPPYDVTFSDFTTSEIRDRGASLGIGSSLQALLTQEPDYDIIFMPLGQSYLDSFPVEEIIDSSDGSTQFVLFNQEDLEQKYDNVRSIPARLDEAKEMSEIVVAVKGRFLQNFAAHRARNETPTTFSEIIDFCQSSPTSQSQIDC